MSDNEMVPLPARNTDPDTSRGAMRKAKLRSQYANITDLIRKARAHDQLGFQVYLQNYGKISPSGYRTRRCELVRQGVLRNSGRTTKLTDSGKLSIIWEVAG
jgi:hypothetical protein